MEHKLDPKIMIKSMKKEGHGLGVILQALDKYHTNNEEYKHYALRLFVNKLRRSKRSRRSKRKSKKNVGINKWNLLTK